MMDYIVQLVRGGIELLERPAASMRITDLDGDSFGHILRHLTVYDLFTGRLVCRYFLQHIDRHLETIRSLTYDRRLNGVRMRNGEFVFSVATFDALLEKMPNVRSLRFESCPEMRGALACCSHNIFKPMVDHLLILDQLHVTRCRGVNTGAFRLLVDEFPSLTHLSVTVYNELCVKIIAKGLPNLKHLDLGDSCIDNYGPYLRHFGCKISTFIAPPEYNNNKYSVLDGLVNGNGIYLKRLELKVRLSDSDETFFQIIGQKFDHLLHLKCTIDSRRTSSDNQILLGLSRLAAKLEALHLSEQPLWSSWLSCIDDQTMISILQNCYHLKELAISTGKVGEDQCQLVTDLSMRLISECCPDLEVLALKSVDITDATLESIDKLDCLRELRLEWLPLVSGSGIMRLAEHSVRVKQVDISRCAHLI